MSIVIKELSEKDKMPLEKIYRETVLKEFFEYTLNIRKYLTSSPEKDAALKLPIKIGAFYNQKLIGYLMAEKPYGGILFIPWLAILKEHQHKGVGKKLLKSIEKKASILGVHSIHLQSDKLNVPFYEKCGYTVFGFDEKGYWGTDNYLLKKPIMEPHEEAFLK